MTGTPLDLTPFGGLLAAVGWLYWALALVPIALALWLPRAWWLKLASTAVVVGAVVYPVFVRPVQNHVDERERDRIEYQQRLAEATAQFEMRCRSAGEFIRRTVDNVEEVVWMKWRDKRQVADDYDQFTKTDPFGRDCEAEGCIEQLLTLPEQGGRFAREVQQRKGRFRWVETVDPADGRMYRYSGSMKPVPSWTPEAIEERRRRTGKELEDYSYWFKTDRQPIERFTARYGITWDDISTPEDREHWIAGGRLQVIDLQTNEVIGERIGYMMDRGLGDRSGFRTPWSFAKETACPNLVDESGRRSNIGFTNRFLERVLKPN